MVKAQSSIEYIYLIGGVLIVAFIAVILMLSLVGDEPIFVMPFIFDPDKLPLGSSSFDSGEIFLAPDYASNPNACGGFGHGCEGRLDDPTTTETDETQLACDVSEGGQWGFVYCNSGFNGGGNIHCEQCQDRDPDVLDCDPEAWACIIDGEASYALTIPSNAQGDLYLMLTAYWGDSGDAENVEVNIGGNSKQLLTGESMNHDGVSFTFEGTRTGPVAKIREVSDGGIGQPEADVAEFDNYPNSLSQPINVADISFPVSGIPLVSFTIGGDSRFTDDFESAGDFSSLHRCVFENTFNIGAGDQIKFQSYELDASGNIIGRGESVGIVSYRLFGEDRYADVIASYTDLPNVQLCEDKDIFFTSNT